MNQYGQPVNSRGAIRYETGKQFNAEIQITMGRQKRS